ncbi:hypothetical protein [Halopiger goleimassiliensis]|uniref:hypothetical protein n=1 Tax=Halopiger goleimassiliensis TaxID=1293048 RepID=UPI000677F920|nr:hypothetical protein [Halopiger goleimassiliensis]
MASHPAAITDPFDEQTITAVTRATEPHVTPIRIDSDAADARLPMDTESTPAEVHGDEGADATDES